MSIAERSAHAWLGLALTVFLASTLSADTVELKTGERVEGTFRQAGASGVVIEVGGQSITLPVEKVRAIFFGTAKLVAPAGPPPWQDSLDALKGLRSVTTSGIAYRDYATRVLDARVRIDRYLSFHDDKATEAQGAIRVAILEYELASHAWEASLGNILDAVQLWPQWGKILEDLEVAKCPLAKAAIDLDRRKPSPKLDHTKALGAAFYDVYQSEGAAKLWACAADEITAAELSLSPH